VKSQCRTGSGGAHRVEPGRGIGGVERDFVGTCSVVDHLDGCHGFRRIEGYQGVDLSGAHVQERGGASVDEDLNSTESGGQRE
jgi:hypothetical protein